MPEQLATKHSHMKLLNNGNRADHTPYPIEVLLDLLKSEPLAPHLRHSAWHKIPGSEEYRVLGNFHRRSHMFQLRGAREELLPYRRAMAANRTSDAYKHAIAHPQQAAYAVGDTVRITVGWFAEQRAVVTGYRSESEHVIVQGLPGADYSHIPPEHLEAVPDGRPKLLWVACRANPWTPEDSSHNLWGVVCPLTGFKGLARSPEEARVAVMNAKLNLNPEIEVCSP